MNQIEVARSWEVMAYLFIQLITRGMYLVVLFNCQRTMAIICLSKITTITLWALINKQMIFIFTMYQLFDTWR